METTVVMINLFGAVALLLFGLAQVKDGVSRAFGAKVKTGLASGTRGGVRSFVSGFVATVALQSSTATALMVASFVERELVKPRMAQIVLLGANVGTVVTAWIVAIGIEWLSPLVILVSIVLYRSGSTNQQGGGAGLIGIGLMLPEPTISQLTFISGLGALAKVSQPYLPLNGSERMAPLFQFSAVMDS